MRRTTHSAALIAAIAGLAASTGVAQAGTSICVPAQAGVAVVSAGPNSTCDSVSTPVQLPSSAADQQKLISILPYLSFTSSGIGGKPTITFKGVNIGLLNANYSDISRAGDGTGNLVIGRQHNPYGYARTGSLNVVVGDFHGWTSNGNLVAGEANRATGKGAGAVLGVANTVTGSAGSSVLGGRDNTASGDFSTVLGGFRRAAKREYEVIADGDVFSARVDEHGKVTAKSEPGIQSVDGGVGMTWVEFPGVNANNCTAAITPIVSGGGTVSASRYRSGDGPWVLVTTTHQDKLIETAFDIVLSC